MKQQHKQKLRSLSYSLFFSFLIHMIFGISSFAIWHALKNSALSTHALPQENLLTASVEFIPIQSMQAATLNSSNSEEATVKKTTAQKNNEGKLSVQKASTISRTNSQGSSLPDIVANPGNKQPIYPESARADGIEATCFMKLRILKNGTVDAVALDNLKSCPAIFVKSAQKALLSWTFSKHQSEYIEKVVPVIFKLSE